MELNDSQGRHARGGGHPGHVADHARRVAWVPAFAGMTLALVFSGSGSALAHTGMEHALSFASGFAHPWTGLDHMLAMVAVGLWAGLNGGRALWAWPISFVGVMVLGGALGMAGIGLPLVEQGILASIVVLGLLVLATVRLPVAVGAVLVAAFALLHGHAHGAEVPGDAATVTYVAGFVIATGILHVIGIGVAQLAGDANGRIVVRGAGAAVAMAGVALTIA